jgi:DNA (cytosine-5)-methyltransferase 1
MPGKNYIGIDLFSGAGGLSLGAKWAGINITYAVEFDKSAAETYKLNHSECNVLPCDITSLSKEDIKIETPFIIFGGPPCQGFSASNQKTRTLDNPKNKLYSEFIKLIELFKPQWVVFENVEGIVSFQNGLVVEAIKKDLENIETLAELGYTVRKGVLNAADFGVPQARRRFFLVANRVGKDFQFPTPQEQKISVQEAIGDLPFLKNGDKSENLPYKTDYISDYIKLMREDSQSAIQNYVSLNKDYVIVRYTHIKQGENWKVIPKELMRNYNNTDKCHSGIYRRLRASEPSIVISNYRKNMLIHPFEDRGLSIREAARLQSFPDTFQFCGTINEMQQQIGNAVPPLLAKAVFERILQYNE